MQDELSQEEMQVQATAQVRELMAAMTEAMVANVSKALSSGAHPPHWNKEGDYRLAKAIVDSGCVDRPYNHRDKQTQKDFANIRLFL